ncbi:copper resistance protein CopC, partial [Acinetobacter baumannii]
MLSTTPAARATIAATNRLSLTFSEKLMPQLSSIDLVMTGMPGMAHAAPMKMTGATTSVSKDGKTLV